ncbi:MAG: HAD hydrolase-like protein [Verrucomicrobiota bacterium]
MKKRKKLLLWDIDGTLISTAGAGICAFLKAASRLYGMEATIDGIPCAGRTDTKIAVDMLKKYGVEITEPNIQNLLQAYIEELPGELPRYQGKVFPGVLEILRQSQQRGDIVTGLLTGNLARGAELKLSHYKIWQYFSFGAFADDSANRNELGPIALKKAHAQYGIQFSPENVYIIGDTPHDIECAQAIHAHSIAVATGGYKSEHLSPHNPTVLWENLQNTSQFFNLME